MRIMRGSKHFKDDGFVSIFSVLIIMAVLTLIMIGFSNITRRAQRETLDDQLNTQAYYAAESAVNEAIAYLKVNPGFTKSSCQSGGTGFTYNNNLDVNLNVGYSCLLISKATSDIRLSPVPVQSDSAPKVFPFESAGLAPSTFDVEVSAASGSMTVPSTVAGELPQASARAGTDIGVLRVDLSPTNSYDRVNMISGGYTFFLYFTSSNTASSGTVTAGQGTAAQGNALYVRCATGSMSCTANIRLGGVPATKYVMRVSSVYTATQVRISNIRDASNNPVSLANGQTIIDATGKANDVFRRVQFRMPSFSSGLIPSYAIQSADSICKRLRVHPTNTASDLVDSACLIN